MVVLNGVPENPPCFGQYPQGEACNDCPATIKVACIEKSPERD